MRNIVWQLYFLLSSWLGFAQSVESEIIAELPSDLSECSGMVFINDSQMAMINDGGNDPALFIIDTTGKHIETIDLDFLENKDWESLAIGTKELFIGDFGNNKNNRRDLKVYVLDTDNWDLKREIKFYYPEQSSFPANKEERYYDLEAMLYRNDSLLLFTKNRTEPFDGLVRVYYLNPKLNEQAAILLDEFELSKGFMHFQWVCGASPGFLNNDLFLIGYQYLWYIPEYKTGTTPGGLRFDLGYFSQKEALCYKNGSLYFTEESHFSRPGRLHRADVSFLQNFELNKGIGCEIENKHFKDSLEIQLHNAPAFEGVAWEVYAKDGSVALSDTIRNQELKNHKLSLDLKSLSKGSHLLSINHRQQKQVFIIYRD